MAFGQIPWAHNVLLLQKVKDGAVRLLYAGQTLQQGWSRDTLTGMILSDAQARQSAAINNFTGQLAQEQSAMTGGLLKDPCIFDFLTIAEPFQERGLGDAIAKANAGSAGPQ